ncbi:MAG: DUF4012 domain-containing protein [Candidatus Levybacteria bacterium]|nr:DUF4012 domain-containing protein [Candidatus Levybacteria bacterium]
MVSSAPILIIDRLGIVGEPLSLKLSREFSIIFVSERFLRSSVQEENITHILFSRKFPKIPDNSYSHIIVIEEAESDLEFLPKIIEKVKSINSDFIFAQRLSAESKYFAEKIQKLHVDSKVILYGDVFGKKLINEGKGFRSVTNKLIYQAQKFGKMQVVGDGLVDTYPVFVDDVVDGIIDVVFRVHRQHSLFYLFPKHPPTEIFLAHAIQKNNPEVTIDFVRHSVKKEETSYPSGGKYLLDDKYPLAKRIRLVDIGKKKGGEKPRETQYSHKKKNRFPFFIWIAVFLLFSPLFFTSLFSFLGFNFLNYAKNQIDKGSLSSAQRSVRLSTVSFYLGKKASEALDFQVKIIGREDSFKNVLGKNTLGERISLGLMQVFNAGNYFTKVLNGSSKSAIEDFLQGENNLRSAILSLNNLRAEGNSPALLLGEIEEMNPLLRLLSNTSGELSDMLGMESQKKYLILFQNNMELRPGGGLIGSYGVLKLNKGQIMGFSTHDVYDADDKLRGHVEPPFAIRRYFPSEHWYLRDSNFNVDFAESASASSNFLYAETGERVDGVIGIDVSFIKSILQVIGPVIVSDYGETVSEDNIYSLVQMHADKKFAQGSIQSKDFLRSLFEAVLTKISKGKISPFSLAKSISDSLAQKHLLFAFNNDLQNLFTVNGWSSSLWDERKDGDNIINDFLGISEANLGFNNINYLISRDVSQKTSINTDGNISSEVTIKYKNSSSLTSGGDYKNYLRLILPKEAAISSISINDISQKIIDAVVDPKIYGGEKFVSPKGLEIEKTFQEDKVIYGFIINVPAGELMKINAQYDFKKEVDLGENGFSYTLRVFKQPGIDSLPFAFSLTYPSDMSTISLPDGLIKKNSSLIYSKNITEDKGLTISFARK